MITTFDPHQYAIDCGWDFTSIQATAEHGLSDTDAGVIDQLAGVHGDDYDPATDDDAAAEAAAVEAAQAARDSLLRWCKAKVAEAKGNA